MLDSIIKYILVPEEEIKDIAARLGKEINRDYADKNLILVCVLKGSLMFTADLAKNLDVVCEMEFLRASSYGNATESSGQIKMLLDFDRDDFDQCDFLLIEDIIDSGNTLSHLVKHLKDKGARSVKTCTLLDKPSRRKAPIYSDYFGFEVPDAFIVGYGLDYAEKYRNLPYIGVLKPEIYE